MGRARGHADDLETLFACYNELDETSEMSITDAPETGPQTERGRRIADEFKHHATEAANWATAQLTLL
jgi:hypothetical protein